MASGAADVSGRRQDRHAVAGLLPGLSLRTRLSLVVGVIVATVVGAAAVLELRMFEQTLESELIDAARITAIAVADDLELRGRSGNDGDVGEMLHQFLEVNAAVRAITVVDLDQDATRIVASTLSVERPVAVDVARDAMTTGDVVSIAEGPLRFVGVPLAGARGPMAVVVTVSMAAVDRVARRGSLIAVLVALPAIAVVTLLLDLLSRRLVHRRIEAIRDTMQRVASGDMAARAPVGRVDEIGAIVIGLNSMLEEMQGFSESLQRRVKEATTELRARNSEVEEMYRRVFDLREALGRAEQMAAVGQTAANVAHQIGTPLNLISGYVQILLADNAIDARTRRRLEMVERQIGQVAGAVRGLLDRSRYSSPRETLEPRRLIERVLEIAQPRIDRNRVRVTVTAADGLPKIEADTVQLELALLNLVTNAIDAMSDAGALTVTLSPTAAGVRLEIADNGSGVPESLLPRIFEPWVTTKPVGRGTGLGLAIARDVVVAHGGTIAIANRPTGGAVCTVELPAVPPESKNREPQASSLQAAPQRS
jgi:two-component system, NtrC family, sensor kinase